MMKVRQENDKALIAAAYDSISHEYDKIVVEVEYAVTSWLKSELTDYTWRQVLDLACGSGNLGVILRSINSETALEGIDLSSGMLYQAEQKRIYSRLVQHDLDQSVLPLSLSQADIALIFGVFEFLREPSRLLREISGLMQPEGRLFCSFQRRLDDLSESIQNTHGFYHHTYTNDEVEKLIAGAGFEIIKADPVIGYVSPSNGIACPYLLVHAQKMQKSEDETNLL